MTHWFTLSIRELREALLDGRTTCAALTAYFLGRIRRYGGRDGVNAIAALDPTAAQQAEMLDRQGDRSLPLYGIPFLVKDNIDVAGLPTTAGSLAFTDNLPEADAPIVRTLKAAGAICLGKTNMTELANFCAQGMPNGYSSAGGQVLNAYDRSADPGGSSSGSAVAVSLGLVPFALGTDTSFSVIGCASRNGVYGWKPCQMDVDCDGILPISRMLDTPGVFTQRFEDLLSVHQVISHRRCDACASEPPRTMGINTWREQDVSDQQLALYATVVSRLQARGISSERLCFPSSTLLKEIMYRDFTPSLEDYLRTAGAGIRTMRALVAYYHAHPDTMMRYWAGQLEKALSLSEEQGSAGRLDEIRQERLRLREEAHRCFSRYDGVLMTGPDVTMHVVNLPSISIPMGPGPDGLGRNMIVYGTDTARLLRLARSISEVTDSMPYPPEVEASLRETR